MSFNGTSTSCSPSPSCSCQSFLHDLTAFDSRAATSESESSLIRKRHSKEYFLNLTVFLVDGMIHQRGLEVARDHLREQIKNQQGGILMQSLPTLIPLLQLADVESRLGDILHSYAATVQYRNILQNLYGKDSLWVYWAQRLEIKILRRGGMFERANGLALEMFEYQKEQLEVEEENLQNGHEDGKSCASSWIRLSIMADQLVQLRKFQEALKAYEMSRQQILEIKQYENEEDKSGNFFYVENRIIKLLLKMRRYDEAMELTQPLLTAQKSRCGERHYSVLKTKHHMAVILKYQGNYEKALELAEELANRIKLNINFDSDQLYDYLNPKMYPAVEVNLAELRLFLGLPYESLASTFYSQVFELVLELLGETHPLKLETTLNLATWYMRHKKDKFEFSRQLFDGLYSLQLDMWGRDDPDTQWTQQFMDHFHRKKSRVDGGKMGCGCNIL